MALSYSRLDRLVRIDTLGCRTIRIAWIMNTLLALSTMRSQAAHDEGIRGPLGDLPTDQAWRLQNLINNLLIQVTTDGEEGRQAFNEKRPPNFHRRAAPPRRCLGRALGRGRRPP